MKISLTSITVNDQKKALDFYTGILGFQKKNELPMGPFSWITVVSPDDPEGTELVLEPCSFPIAKKYQEGLYKAQVPAHAFEEPEIDELHEKLKRFGIEILMPPTIQGSNKLMIFNDTCGNWIQVYKKV